MSAVSPRACYAPGGGAGVCCSSSGGSPFGGGVGGGSPLFAAAPRPRRSAAPLPRRALSEDEAGEVHFAFERLSAGQLDDATGEPLATPRQLKLALRAFGVPAKKADVRGLLRDCGLDADAPLTRGDFFEACAAKLLERGAADDAARAFALFDVAGRGRVGADALRAVARQLGADVSDAELRAMVAEFDADGDGEIDAAEFAAILAEAAGGA